MDKNYFFKSNYKYYSLLYNNANQQNRLKIFFTFHSICVMNFVIVKLILFFSDIQNYIYKYFPEYIFNLFVKAK